MNPQRDNRVRAGHKLSEVANLVGVFRATVYAIKKPMDDTEGVNRRTDSGQKTVVGRDSLRDAIQGTASLAIIVFN